jgi:hypothetical protein
MLDYMARCCYMLQQGKFVADVCFYYGDQAPNLVPSRRIDPTITPIYESTKCYHCGKPKPVNTESLGHGYDYDYVNEDIILNHMRVKDGKIVLTGGMSYHMMVLPDRKDISPEVLVKIGELVKSGATVVGPKPSKSNSLKNYPVCDTQVRDLAGKIWGTCDGKNVKQNNYGKGKVIWNVPLNDVMVEMDVLPDFQVSNINNQDQHIDYIHRATNREDIYFISNSLDDWQDVDCAFRVAAERIPYLWDPDNGSIKKVQIYQVEHGTINLNLKLPPFASIFVVFKKGDGQSQDPEFRTILKTITSCIYPDKSWTLKFPKGWGAPDSIRITRLFDWVESPEPGVKFFSGTAEYNNQFMVPDSLLDRKYSLLLHLGEVKEVAEVFVNGQKQGILWKKPYRIDISGSVHTGANTLEIYVTNLWNNRIVGDLQADAKNTYTHTNIKYKFNKDSPLLSSGLIGPVEIRPAIKISSDIDRK